MRDFSDLKGQERESVIEQLVDDVDQLSTQISTGGQDGVDKIVKHNRVRFLVSGWVKVVDSNKICFEFSIRCIGKLVITPHMVPYFQTRLEAAGWEDFTYQNQTITCCKPL